MKRRDSIRRYMRVVGLMLCGLVLMLSAGCQDESAVESEENDYPINTDERQMTEEEAARAIFSYMYSECDYDYDSMVSRTLQEGKPRYSYYLPEETNDHRKEQLWYNGLSDDKEFYIFTYYTQYGYDQSENLYDYEYHSDYAVDKETGEVLQERKWVLTDEGGELIYSETYQDAVNQAYFENSVPDGNMTEEEAARALFSYMYSYCDYDYDSMVTRATQQEQPIYVYQTPLQKSDCSVSKLWCKGLTEDNQYYIFAYYTDYYEKAYSQGEMSEISFSHYQYPTDYAVDRRTGEVLQEREWVENDEEFGWVYSEEYDEAVNLSD